MAVYQSFYFQYITNTTQLFFFFKEENTALLQQLYNGNVWNSAFEQKKFSTMILQQSHFLYIKIYFPHNQLLADNGNKKKTH